MKSCFFTAACFALASTPTGIADMADKEPIGLALVVKADTNPLGRNHVAVDIKNSGDEPFEIWSKLPNGVGSTLDIAIWNAEGERVTPLFYRRSISSPFDEVRLCATIAKGKSIEVEIRLFEGVETIPPGKYKYQVRFEYEGLMVSSKEVEIEVTKAHVVDRHK